MNLSSRDDIVLLNSLAERLERDSGFIAWALARFTQHENISTRQELANRLGADEVALTRLALCKRPKTDTPNFPQRVRAVAEYSKVEAGALANILRMVELLESKTVVEVDFSPAFLAAARDRVEEPSSRERSISEMPHPDDLR